MTNKILAMAALCSLLSVGGLRAQQLEGTAQSRSFVSFEPAQTVSVAAGGKTAVTLTFHVQPGYHINSNTPNEPELIPTQLHFSLPGEIAIGKVQYPAGELKSFPFDPTQKLSVYSGDIVIHAMVLAPQTASTGPLTVHGELRYQACDNNACYPPKKLPMTFDVKVGAATASKTPRAHGNKQSPHIH